MHCTEDASTGKMDWDALGSWPEAGKDRVLFRKGGQQMFICLESLQGEMHYDAISTSTSEIDALAMHMP